MFPVIAAAAQVEVASSSREERRLPAGNQRIRALKRTLGSQYEAFDKAVREESSVARPTYEEQEAVRTVHAKIKKMMQARFGRSRLIVVGSVGSGLDIAGSDLDCTIVLDDQRTDDNETEGIRHIKQMKAVFQESEEVQVMEWRPGKVPVIKIKAENVPMDITWQNMSSVMSTRLVKWYVDIDV